MLDDAELRVRCSPDDVPEPGWHSHTCPDRDCGTTWMHRTELQWSFEITKDEFRKAHCCPTCGREQRFKHRDHRGLFD